MQALKPLTGTWHWHWWWRRAARRTCSRNFQAATEGSWRHLANTHFEPRCSKFCQKDGMQTQSSYVELGRLGTLWYDAYVALAANLSLTCRLTQLNETKTEQDKVNQCKTLALNLKQWSWPQCIFPHTMESAWPLKGSPLPLRGSPLP